MKLLDATFRDGGYYTDWDFPKELLTDYLKLMDESGTDYVELGYRSISTGKKFLGQFKYVTEAFLNKLPKLRNSKIAIMVDVKEFKDKLNLKKELKKHFIKKERTVLTMIRLAVVYNNLNLGIKIGNILKKLGYEVTINLMQFTLLSNHQLKDIFSKIEKSDIDVIYVADSYGSCTPKKTEQLISISKNFDIDLGVHFHNNTELALANTIKAFELKADYIDGTLLGMGRGAGNLKIEYFMSHLKREGVTKYKITPILKLINKYFENMKKKYDWGPNTAYMLGGMNNVHQSYAQTLLATERYTPEEILNILTFLGKDKRSKSYNQDLIDKAISKRFEDFGGQFTDYKYKDISKFINCMKDKEVLIIGRGESHKNKKDEINMLIEKREPIVIECNYLPEILNYNKNHFCAFALYNNFKKNIEKVYKSKKTPIIPFPKIEKHLAEVLKKINVIKMPFKVKKSKLELNKEEISIPFDVVSMYAISLAILGKVKTIFLAGFDGYEITTNKENQFKLVQAKEMDKFFSMVKYEHPQIKIISITPSKYEIPQKPIYQLIG